MKSKLFLTLLVKVLLTVQTIIYLVLLSSLLLSLISSTDGEFVYMMGNKIPVSCYYFEKTGFKCGACGLTRAWISLSHFKIKGALHCNKEVVHTYSAAILFLLFSTIFFIKISKMSFKLKILIPLLLFILLLIGWAGVISTNIHLKTYELNMY